MTQIVHFNLLQEVKLYRSFLPIFAILGDRSINDSSIPKRKLLEINRAKTVLKSCKNRVFTIYNFINTSKTRFVLKIVFCLIWKHDFCLISSSEHDFFMMIPRFMKTAPKSCIPNL